MVNIKKWLKWLFGFLRTIHISSRYSIWGIFGTENQKIQKIFLNLCIRFPQNFISLFALIIPNEPLWMSFGTNIVNFPFLIINGGLDFGKIIERTGIKLSNLQSQINNLF